MENNRDKLIHEWTMEKEELVAAYDRMKEDLENDLNNVQRERDDNMIFAENDKQQALSLAEQVCYGDADWSVC